MSTDSQAGKWRDAIGSRIWRRRRHAGETGIYIGLVADDLASVDAAYAATISADGGSEGEPAIWSYFRPGYYAADIGDFDGNHLEIVNKNFSPPSRSHH